MGKIIKRLRLIGDRGEARAQVVFDSAASASLIREKLARKLFSQFTEMLVPRTFHGVNGLAAFQARRTCTLQIEMKGVILDGLFYVVEKLPRDIILGVDFLQRWEIKLDMKREDFTTGVDPGAIEILAVS